MLKPEVGRPRPAAELTICPAASYQVLIDHGKDFYLSSSRHGSLPEKDLVHLQREDLVPSCALEIWLCIAPLEVVLILAESSELHQTRDWQVGPFFTQAGFDVCSGVHRCDPCIDIIAAPVR